MREQATYINHQPGTAQCPYCSWWVRTIGNRKFLVWHDEGRKPCPGSGRSALLDEEGSA